VNELQRTDGEKSLFRWGGLAGILGGVLFLFVFVFVGAVVGPDPAGPEGPVSRFPEIRAARTLENALYLTVLALFVINFLALYRALRLASLAPALFGSVMAIVGLAVLAAGALPHIATTRLADLYHAPGASSEDQATVALLWQANQGIFDALLAVGLVLLPIGLVALGAAMLRARAFGGGYGGTTLALGLTGIGSAAALLLDPVSPIAVIGFLALIVFHLVLGWKVYRLSREAGVAPADLAHLRATEGSLSA
jgi:hypothetical protein